MSDIEFFEEIMKIICDDNNSPKITVTQFEEIISSFLQQSASN